MEWLIDFWNTGENSNEIILIIAGVIIGSILTLSGKLFIWIGRMLWQLTKKVNGSIRKKYSVWIKKREYKKTIRQIEKQEIEIPRYFLLNKSREKNPELNKVFDMIEDGTLPAPSIYALQKMIAENPDKFKLNFDQDTVNLPKINKPPF